MTDWKYIEEKAKDGEEWAKALKELQKEIEYLKRHLRISAWKRK